jgi:hypothetical protein
VDDFEQACMVVLTPLASPSFSAETALPLAVECAGPVPERCSATVRLRAAETAMVERSIELTRGQGLVEGSIEPGVYDVVVDSPGHAPVIARRVYIPTDRPLRVSLAKGAVLRGTVPPGVRAECRVEVTDAEGLLLKWCRAKPQGAFRIDGLAEGRYDFSLKRGERVTHRASLEVAAGQRQCLGLDWRDVDVR